MKITAHGSVGRGRAGKAWVPKSAFGKRLAGSSDKIRVAVAYTAESYHANIKGWRITSR